MFSLIGFAKQCFWIGDVRDDDFGAWQLLSTIIKYLQLRNIYYLVFDVLHKSQGLQDKRTKQRHRRGVAIP